jgi:hypothetical protein
MFDLFKHAPKVFLVFVGVVLAILATLIPSSMAELHNTPNPVGSYTLRSDSPPSIEFGFPNFPSASEPSHPTLVNQEDIYLLPPPGGDKTQKLDVGSGTSVAMDHLGPVVVNTDGTLSRISNWASMSPSEQALTAKRIAARNQDRLAKLSAEMGSNSS